MGAYEQYYANASFVMLIKHNLFDQYNLNFTSLQGMKECVTVFPTQKGNWTGCTKDLLPLKLLNTTLNDEICETSNF